MATASSATPPLARSTTWVHGTSSAVSTATTPGTSRAAGALVSAIGPPGGLVGVLLDRVDDLAVAGAAAQVADQLATDPFAARPPLVLEQRIGRLHRQQQARADGLAVQQHRAGPAHALAAPVADLVMAERVPEHVEQRLVREHPGVPSRAVDREGDPLPADVAHGPGSWFARARCTASASARRPRTAAMRRRYPPEACTSSSGSSMPAARSVTRSSSAGSGAAPSSSSSGSAGTSQGRSATPPMATEAPATAPAVSSSTRAATPTTIQSELRRVSSRNDQPLRSGWVGTRTSVMTSSGSSAVVRYDTSRSRTARSRAPSPPRTVTSAPRAAATQGSSPPGSACARLPPIVPRARLRALPTKAVAAARMGQRRRTTSACSRARCRVSVGRRRYPPRSSIGPAPTGLMSISQSGRATRRFSIGTRLCPPAMTFASSPCSRSARTASSKELTRWYWKGAATIASTALAGRRRVQQREHRGDGGLVAGDHRQAEPPLQLRQGRHGREVGARHERQIDGEPAQGPFGEVEDLLHRHRGDLEVVGDPQAGDAGDLDAAGLDALLDALVERVDIGRDHADPPRATGRDRPPDRGDHADRGHAGQVADAPAQLCVIVVAAQRTRAGAAEDDQVGPRGGEVVRGREHVLVEHAALALGGGVLQVHAPRVQAGARRQRPPEVGLHHGVRGRDEQPDPPAGLHGWPLSLLPRPRSRAPAGSAAPRPPAAAARPPRGGPATRSRSARGRPPR